MPSVLHLFLNAGGSPYITTAKLSSQNFTAINGDSSRDPFGKRTWLDVSFCAMQRHKLDRN